MKFKGETVRDDGEIIRVWECEFCGSRSTDWETIRACEISCHHKEEAMVNNL